MIGELTNHLWQSTMFSVLAGLMTVAFRKNRAQVRYWLWLSASFKFFVPFSLLMSVGGSLGWTPAAQKITAQIATPAVAFTVDQITQTFPSRVKIVTFTGSTRDWAPIAIFGLW